MSSSFDNLVKSCSAMKVITEVVYNSYEIDFRLYFRSNDNPLVLSLRDKQKEQIATDLRNDIIKMLNSVFNNDFNKRYAKDIFGCEYEEVEKIAKRLIPLIPIMNGDYSFSKDASLLFDDSINQIGINLLDRGISELNHLLTNYFNYSSGKEVSEDKLESDLFMFYYKNTGYDNVISARNAHLSEPKRIRVKNM